jgi:hypothetical protein
MEGKAHRTPTTASAPGNAAVCVLLAFLLLYNPFLALYCSRNNNSIHNPQRNRATVGASELQHVGLVEKETPQADLTVENRHEVAAPAGSFLARGSGREEEVPQLELSTQIWSRPPPTL